MNHKLNYTRFSAISNAHQNIKIDPADFLEPLKQGAVRDLTFTAKFRPDEIDIIPDNFYSHWIDIRALIAADKLIPRKNNARVKLSREALHAFFSAEDRIISLRWEVTVPDDQRQGLELHLRAIHMDPERAEAVGLIKDNVLSCSVYVLPVVAMDIIPVSSLAPITYPFYPIVISNRPLSKVKDPLLHSKIW